MKAPTRTLAIGLAAAVLAAGGGAVVASASDHASFASSATQDDPRGFGRFGGPPGGQRITPPSGPRAPSSSP